MAIDLLANPTATAPTALADYQAILTQLVANGQAFTGRLIVQGSNIKAGTVILIGGVLYKATTDTAITGTASNYVKITPSGATASAAFVANLTGVTWNDAYGGYYDGSGNLHVFDEGLAVSSGVITSPKTLIGFSAGPRKRTFTSSGTFVVPTDVTEVWVTGCAAGGNGGAGAGGGSGAAVTGGGGGGGGSGNYVVKKSVSVTPGSSITVTIGAVGANTTFGGLLTLAFGISGGAGVIGTGTGASGSGGPWAGSGGVPGADASGFGGKGGASAGSSKAGGGGAQGFIDSSVSGSAGSSGTGASPGAGGSGGSGGGGGGGGSAGGTTPAGGNGGAGGSAGGYGGGGGGGGGGFANGSGGAGGAGGPAILIVEW